MEKFIIHGGKPLAGEIEVKGAKNSATALIAASLLFDGEIILNNVPEIEDVKRMIEIVNSLGIKTEWLEKNKLYLKVSDINPADLKQEVICKLRSSVLFIGSLLSRLSELSLPHPGGCQIGARPLDAHLMGFEKCGFSVENSESGLYFKRIGSPHKEILLSEISPTATVNLILALCKSDYKAVLYGADYGYSVQELAGFLNQAGAKIKISGHTIEIEGVKKLHSVEYTVMPDPIETGTFVCLAAATGSELIIKNSSTDFFAQELEKLKMAQVGMEIIPRGQIQGKNLSDIIVKPSKLRAVKKLNDMPYPGFMSDLLSPFAVLMTQAEGTTLIHDWMYEGRTKYVNELIKMGANATICDPHRVIIVGPTKLYGQEMEITDLRAGATLVIAGLVAEGESRISNVYQIDRGYESIESRLKKIGADIKKVKI
ncbi:UDP-N-acetylglucosamine 1-carboxyvinyltransferase [Candidatus Parcubacteria bacterium]|nr:MAG: UDP-N-acetylglucosamine 1-carboxyvinyltransferase [Candidatus Parcubacteria bacterium]